MVKPSFIKGEYDQTTGTFSFENIHFYSTTEEYIFSFVGIHFGLVPGAQPPPDLSEIFECRFDQQYAQYNANIGLKSPTSTVGTGGVDSSLLRTNGGVGFTAYVTAPNSDSFKLKLELVGDEGHQWGVSDFGDLSFVVKNDEKIVFTQTSKKIITATISSQYFIKNSKFTFTTAPNTSIVHTLSGDPSVKLRISIDDDEIGLYEVTPPQSRLLSSSLKLTRFPPTFGFEIGATPKSTIPRADLTFQLTCPDDKTGFMIHDPDYQAGTNKEKTPNLVPIVTSSGTKTNCSLNDNKTIVTCPQLLTSDSLRDSFVFENLFICSDKVLQVCQVHFMAPEFYPQRSTPPNLYTYPQITDYH
jgi:hypothetical protein